MWVELHHQSGERITCQLEHIAAVSEENGVAVVVFPSGASVGCKETYQEVMDAVSLAATAQKQQRTFG